MKSNGQPKRRSPIRAIDIMIRADRQRKRRHVSQTVEHYRDEQRRAAEQAATLKAREKAKARAS